MFLPAAGLESIFGYCVGCKIFGLLMRLGVVPATVCAECADISSGCALGVPRPLACAGAMRPRAARLAGLGTTIFTEMTALAARTGAINLGQGFPDTDGPAAVIEAAVGALRGGQNQYAPLPGVPALREAVLEHQRARYGLEPEDVLITFGATEAIAAALLALCDPGDEVVVLEPYYDSYAACIAFAGATRRPVTLRPPDFELDATRWRRRSGAGAGGSARCSSTRPTTRPAGCCSRAELELVAAACVRARPGVRQRRGLRAPRLRRRAHPARHPAGHGRADADDLQRRQVVLVHGLEDRLVLGAGGARRRDASRSSSS